jgi:hypothetical protein
MNQNTLLDRVPPTASMSVRSRRAAACLSWSVIVVLVAAGSSSMMGPSARGADTPLAEFSAVRANSHVQEIAREPHPMGSAAIRGVEAYLTAQLAGMGLDPEVRPVEVPDYFGSPGETTTVRNIVAVIPGTASSKAIALVAHYDTHPNTPGANDNSVAVAVLLEAARATLAGDRPGNDVLLVFTDGEEPQPRYGATAFARFHPTFEQVGLVVNLEAIGSSGPSMLIESSRPETGIVDRYRRTATDPAAFSFLTETVDLFGGVGTDFDVFKDEAIPGLGFAYLRNSPIYHTDRDTHATVSMNSVQHHGDNVMAVLGAFGNTELPLRATDADAVFFTLTPLVTVGYSSFVAEALAVVVGGAFGVLVWRRLVSKRDSVAAIGRGSLVLVVGSSAAALGVFIAWWGITAIRSTPGLWESYLYLVVLCGLAALVLAFLAGTLAGRFGDSELATGIVGVWVVLAAVTTVGLPGFSYLFIWPALGGLVALAGSSSGRFGGRLWPVVAAPAVILAIPALDAFFQMAQPRPGNPDSDLTVAVALIGLLAALIVGLVVPFGHGSRSLP